MNIGNITQQGMTLIPYLSDLPAQWSGNFEVGVTVDAAYSSYTPYLSIGYMNDNVGDAILLPIADNTAVIPPICFQYSGLVLVSLTLINGDEILNTKPIAIRVEHAPMVMSQVDPDDSSVQALLQALIDTKFAAVIPTGGTTGQVLAKASNDDYDLEWISGGGGGGAVNSVNGQTGTVVLDADDVGALPSNTTYVSSVNGSTGAVVIGNATTSSAGLMSATDKQHLEAVYADYSSAITALGA